LGFKELDSLRKGVEVRSRAQFGTKKVRGSDFVQPGLANDFALPEHTDLVAQRLDFAQDVRAQDDRRALLMDFSDQFDHGESDRRVEVLGRFVQDHQGAGASKDTTDREFPAHAGGHESDASSQVQRESVCIGKSGGFVASRVHGGKELDAIAATHEPKEFGFSREVSDPLPDQQALRAAVEVLDAGSTGGWFEVAQQASDEGSFSRPIRPEQAEDRVFRDGQIALVQGPEGPVLFGELIDRENRIRQDWFGHGKKGGTLVALIFAGMITEYTRSEKNQGLKRRVQRRQSLSQRRNARKARSLFGLRFDSPGA